MSALWAKHEAPVGPCTKCQAGWVRVGPTSALGLYPARPCSCPMGKAEAMAAIYDRYGAFLLSGRLPFGLAT